MSFLNARAQELVCGGLMALVIPGVPDITSFEMTAGFRFEILESCLLDMIKTVKCILLLKLFSIAI